MGSWLENTDLLALDLITRADQMAYCPGLYFQI